MSSGSGHSQRAEAPLSAEALARLLADVAHQLRNPAFAISASVDACEAAPGQPLPSVFLEAIRGEAHKLARLASDVQALAEPIAASQDEISGEALVLRAVEQVSAAAAARGVALVRRLPPPCSVRCDAAHLARAIAALIEIAVLRSRAGADVKIMLEVGREPHRDGLMVAITDAGAPYEDGQLATDLEPFATRPIGRAGLGLALAARVARAHGGRVEIRNGAAGGGEVRLVVPDGGERS